MGNPSGGCSRCVALKRTADEVIGTRRGETDNLAFLVGTLHEARSLLLEGSESSEMNSEAQLDHLDDAIEMLTGSRPS